jgi:hypothetical protein
VTPDVPDGDPVREAAVNRLAAMLDYWTTTAAGVAIKCFKVRL